MGWLPSFLGGEKASDPLSRLDPQLREFLEKEAPVKYTPNQPTPPNPSAAPNAQENENKPVTKDGASEKAVPSASLYQDGRYADLWKTYRPLSQVEAETATDHDKLMGVLEGYKGRKNAIGKAALENCALHQEEWANCMKHGSWEDQLQMCRHQVRRFEKCYDMQTRFLRTLGYASMTGRPAEEEEDIQMHADSLWQRVLQHDQAVKLAREEGRPVPKFDPVVPQVAAPAASTNPELQPTDEVRKIWKEKLDKMPEDERAAEEAALRADYAAKFSVARDVRSLREEEKGERKARQAEGKGTIMDTISALFGSGK